MSSEIKPISGAFDRVSLADAAPLDTPFTFNVFPTNACNFRCNYCAQSLGADVLKEKYNFTYETMKLSTFEKAVRQMQEFSAPFKLVSFMGHGEPLLNKDLPKMIRLVKDSKVARRIEIITNGSFLNHKLSEDLVSAGVNAIRVSLQGITSEKYYDVSKIKLDFDKFLDELKYFYSLRGGSELFVKVVDESLEEGEEERFYSIFENCTDRMYVEHIKPVYDGVDYGEKTEEVSVDRYGNAHEKRYACPLPFYMLALWPNGDVAPCDAIYKPLVLGNVQDGNLKAMWQSEKLKNFWRLQLEKNRNKIADCDVCCAPDDVSHPLDVLDHKAEAILKKIG